MIAGYEKHGFHICAEVLPKGCTACPFWMYAITDNTGLCEITGQRIGATEKPNVERMSECPIERWPVSNGESV